MATAAQTTPVSISTLPLWLFQQPPKNLLCTYRTSSAHTALRHRGIRPRKHFDSLNKGEQRITVATTSDASHRAQGVKEDKVERLDAVVNGDFVHIQIS